MNKLIFTILFFLSLPQIILAQDHLKGFEISLKGGLTLANQTGKGAVSETFLNGDSPENFYINTPASTNTKSGFHVGALFEYRFNKTFSMGLGINYIEKGSETTNLLHWNNEKETYEPVSGSVQWNQNYFSIDVPLKFYVPINTNSIHFLGGLTYGKLIHSEEVGDIKISEKSYNYTNDRSSNENEIGFLLGAGYNYLLPNQKNSLGFEFVWNRSLNSLAKDMIPTPLSYYNQAFNFSITYKFDLRKKSL